jgi:nicotinamide-nucleotide amidase
MFTRLADTRLSSHAGPERLYRRVLRVTGRGESHVEELTQPIYDRWRQAQPPVVTTVLASPGLVELHLSSRAASRDAALRVLDAATDALAAVLGDHLVSTGGQSLSQVVGELLDRDGLRVAVGESCTGGLVTARLVDIPGSSSYVEVGVVAYSNEVKRTVLGVDPALLMTDGAVSEAVAVSMAEGARCVGATDIGIGVTGVAGPGGGSDERPVGTVCIGVAGPGSEREVRTVQFPGDRAMIRRQATQAALDLLRRVLLRRTRECATVRGD